MSGAADHLVDGLDYPVLIRFSKNLEQLSKTGDRHSREFKWICIYGLPLHPDVRGERVVWWRSTTATNQWQDDAPKPLVKPCRLHLNDKDDVLGAPRTFVNSKLRHGCLQVRKLV